MPVYRVKCDVCHTESDIIRRVAEYDDLPLHCGLPVHRMVCAPMVAADISPYRSVVTGEVIGGRQQHREHLRRHDLVELGTEKLKPMKSQADHNVKPELIRAVQQHLGR